MRVVIDTNVVLSAAIRDRQPETVILFIAEHPDWEWVASTEIVQEYNQVLRRAKFNLPEPIIRKWTTLFEKLVIVEPQHSEDMPRDQKDAKFLACAWAAKAECLITGDKDFENAYKVGSTTILSVSLFKKLVCAKWEIN